MTTTAVLLRRALEGGRPRATLTLDRAFQGLPDTAHGGSVLAALDSIGALPGPRVLRGHFLRRVPLGVPLEVVVAETEAGAACRVLDAGGTALVDSEVARAGHGDGDRGQAPSTDALPLPISSTCFACGVDNAFGLHARLVADADAVGGTWKAGPAFRDADGRLAPVALTTLLDEAAFWLGALASGESGMTTELVVTLHRLPAADATVMVAGTRAAVRARADDPRYWDTRVAAADERGLVATARITFVAVRGAARRLVTGMLAMNAPEVLRRVFPAYAR